MIAYYQSQPGFEPCDGSASNERASESPASSFIVEERPAEDEPQNVIIPQEVIPAMIPMKIQMSSTMWRDIMFPLPISCSNVVVAYLMPLKGP